MYITATSSAKDHVKLQLSVCLFDKMTSVYFVLREPSIPVVSGTVIKPSYCKRLLLYKSAYICGCADTCVVS